MEEAGDGEMPDRNESGSEVREKGSPASSRSSDLSAHRQVDHSSLQTSRSKGPLFAEAKGGRPVFRVVQAEYDNRLGKTLYKDVGAMWKNTSKSGNEFYTMKIGKLKLLVFANKLD